MMIPSFERHWRRSQEGQLVPVVVLLARPGGRRHGLCCHKQSHLHNLFRGGRKKQEGNGPSLLSIPRITIGTGLLLLSHPRPYSKGGARERELGTSGEGKKKFCGFSSRRRLFRLVSPYRFLPPFFPSRVCYRKYGGMRKVGRQTDWNLSAAEASQSRRRCFERWKLDGLESNSIFPFSQASKSFPKHGL